MKKLFLLIFILCLSCSAFADTKNDSEITFSGNLTIIQDGKKIKVRDNHSILIPKTEEFGTQDDHPLVMAKIFNEEGFTKAEPSLTIKTSKPFTISGKRINGIFYMGKMKNGDELEPALIKIGGEKTPASGAPVFKIPAGTRDYYVEVEMTEEQYKKLLEEDGIKVDDGEVWLDYALLLYFKMRVTPAGLP